MEPTRSSGAGSRNSGTYSQEIAETLRFEEEIQSLVHPSFDSAPVNGGSSFTALLGLPPNQAVELLHDPNSAHSPPPIASAAADLWRFRPTFPSNAALVDRAARYSIFAAEGSPEATSNSADYSTAKPKPEPADSGDPLIGRMSTQRPTGKRKEVEKNKAKGPAKRSRSGEDKSAKPAEENTGGDEKLPYVHVRARRGQATDSHSLAERARREKINARMKLLQELVPGCNKISGTALVLDEIINHVQSLQRQVEFLSMRLAAVNPRMDFISGLDGILSSECGRLTVSDGRGGGSAVGLEQHHQQQQQQQVWHVDMLHHNSHAHTPNGAWERDDETQGNHHHHHVFIGGPHAHPQATSSSSSPSNSLFACHSSSNSVPISNHLKAEL